MHKNPNIIGIDLFSGAGGLTLAAQLVGINIVAAVESDRSASNTYKRNFITSRRNTNKRPKLLNVDIQDLDPKALLEDLSLQPGECALIIGGPPCQGFSTHRINGTGVSDPRNDLLIRYFEFVAAIRPVAFLVENVPGLLWKRHKKYLHRFYKLADEAGYNAFRPKVLNARDYGVPQNRKRVFILGVRRDTNVDVTWPPEPSHGSPGSKKVESKHLKPWLTVRSVFEKPCPEDDPNSIHMNHSRDLVEAFKNTPRNGGSRCDSGRLLQCHKNHNGHKDVYGRIALDRPGPTMTTACINPSKGRFVHPSEDHGITVRQAARIQTFPDSFIFEGGLMAAGKQIGNAVPVKLGIAVLKPIFAALEARRGDDPTTAGDGACNTK